MEGVSRYLIGIDLGTTNCAVAYVDTLESATRPGAPAIRSFLIAQLVGPGEVRALPLLPSFLYFPTAEEISSGSVGLPWQERPSAIVGTMARDQGALAPARQVSSAKSWLSQSAIDRTAGVLPRDADPGAPTISPVEASARYLMHLRNAWNDARRSEADPRQLFENQEIVLTVPASFDEEARELTVEAARQAGLENLTLLEEPLAAFYAWIARNQNVLREHLRDGELVLICDIGGGTSDFSLVRTHLHGENIEFERVAIGEHLLLGGENLDLALALRIEEKLNAELSLRQRHALRVLCAAAKERLLSGEDLDRLPIRLLGGGRSVVGQMLSSELSRDEVTEAITNGFLPLTAPDEMPRRVHVMGLREIGLPYATDPAITKHLAMFLKQAVATMDGSGHPQSFVEKGRPMVKPDAVLFNGGFCMPALVREQITRAIGSWFNDGNAWRPKILTHEAMSSAVALGAAYYARVRRGDGLRVKAGSGSTYYIGLRSERGIKAVCVLPAGTNEGTTFPLLDQEFTVLANRPVSFHLYSSPFRHSAHGAIVELDADEIHRHAPLGTLLRYGKKLNQMELAVRLSASFTELGTLELWCESVNSPHRWRLQFELRQRAGEAAPGGFNRRPPTAIAQAAGISDALLHSAASLIGRTFTGTGPGMPDLVDPASLVGELESLVGQKRESWSLLTSRSFCDGLLQAANGRRLSPRHEVRWLNLFGYCLRPGFGDRQDALRMKEARRVHQAGLAFPQDLQCQIDWLVAWRRTAGGLGSAHQQELRRYLEKLGLGGKKISKRLNSQVEREGWRLLASLEHLPGTVRAALGSELLRRLKREPSDSAWLWSLARFGARIPLYGSLNCVVPAETAALWIATLLETSKLTHETAAAIVQLGRRVDDRARDISHDGIRSVVSQLKSAPAADDAFLRPLEECIVPTRSDVVYTFGEPLPRGMELESTSKCLSPVVALIS